MTKNLVAIALIGTSFLGSTLAASAQDSGLYIKGDLGGTITEDTSLKEFFGPVGGGSRVQFDPGIHFGVEGGYQVTDWLGVEGQTGVMSSEISSISGATRLRDASLSNVPFLAGIRIQCPHPHRISPYIGAGVGYSVSVLDADHLDIGGTHFHGTESDAVFAYQAFGGVRYALNRRMGLSAEYHYFATSDPSWKADTTFGTASDRVRFGGAAIHAISIAFDYHF